MRHLHTSIGILTALLLAPLAPAARAVDLEITITSQVPAGGGAFSPVWLGIHDGTFDTFDSGSAASAEVEAVAELGDTGPITAAFAGQGPQTAAAPGGPFTPGASTSVILSVDLPATNRYLSYLSMFVPSNDLFLGNGNPLAVELFDAGGNFLGPQTVNIFGSMVWDAGTEVNDISTGPAFIDGSDATLGTPEGGVVGLFLDRPDAAAYLATILGQNTPAGYDISELMSAEGLIATIQIEQVPEPGTLTLGAMAACAVALGAYRKRRRVGQASA